MSRYPRSQRSSPSRDDHRRGYEDAPSRSSRPHYDSPRTPSGSDRYNPPQDSNSGFRGPYSDLRRGGREARDRDHRDGFRPPQGEFDFRVERPSRVQESYESFNSGNRGSGDRRDGGDNYRPFPSGRRPPTGPRRGRGGSSAYNQRRPPFQKWVPPKAAERMLLVEKHDGEVQEMLGDKTGRATYRDVDALSDSDEAAMEISDDSDAGRDSAEPAAKRTRLSKATADEGQEAPKWSNPDPYTALPPPDESQRKKKDVVQLIRKARVEADSQKPSAVEEAAEFISCDFSDDESEKQEDGPAPTSNPSLPAPVSSSSSGANRLPPPPPPPISSLPPRPPFPPPPDPSAKRPKRGDKRPADAAPYSSLGNRKRTFDDQIKLPHALLKKPQKIPTHKKVVMEYRVVQGEDPCPWARTDHSDTALPAVRLHKELVDFFEYVKPRDFEHRVREALVNHLDALIRIKWRDASLVAFGSFKSGLFLPTADMDLVICSKSFLDTGFPKYNSRNKIWQMLHFLEGRGVAYENEFEPVLGAKVPLLKYCDRWTGLKIDISFEKQDGVRAIQTFLDWKKLYPAMPKLVAVIKQFLCMRGLNEPVNGGIGGFSVICMVVHLLNQMPQVQSRSMDPEHHLGEVFMEFLDYYGNKFNHEVAAICLDPPREIPKSQVSEISYRNLDRLSIIDPNNPSNDIAGGSSNYNLVKEHFHNAHALLHSRMTELAKGARPVEGYNTILAPIFAGNYSSFERQRNFLRHLDEELSAAPTRGRETPWDKIQW